MWGILNTIASLAEGGEDDDRREEDEDGEDDAEDVPFFERTMSNENVATKTLGGVGLAGEHIGDDKPGVEGLEQGRVLSGGKDEQELGAKGRAEGGFALREDFSELQRSLRSGLKGMASFLAGEPVGDSDKPSAGTTPPARSPPGDSGGTSQTETSQDEVSLPAASLGDPGATAEVTAATEGQPAGSGEQREPGAVAVRSLAPGVGAGGVQSSNVSVASSTGEEAEEKVVKGIQDDLAELSSRLKSGLSQFSSVIRAVRGDDLVKGHQGEGVVPEDGGEEGSPGGGEAAGRSAGGTEEAQEGDDEGKEGERGPTVGAAAAEALLIAAQEDMKAISGTLALGISGFSSLASRFLAAAGAEWEEDEEQEEEEGAERKSLVVSEEDGAVGLTEDVVTFANNVAQHPETWIDFPLPDEEDEPEDFRPSPEQEQHMEALEMRVPRLVAVRLELTPGYISEQRFWKIYFVLLHSHLPPAASAVLSTPAILAARARVVRQLQQAQQKSQEELGVPAEGTEKPPSVPDAHVPATAAPESSPALSSKESDLDAGLPLPVPRADPPPVPAPPAAAVPEPVVVAKEAAASSGAVRASGSTEEEEVEADDWLNDAGGVPGSGAGGEDDDEVSFSDLEEEEGEGEGEGEREGDAGRGVRKDSPAAALSSIPAVPAAAVEPKHGGDSASMPSSGAAVSGAGKKDRGSDWVELKAGQDAHSSGGSDNHSADWQTVDSDDLS